MLQEDRHVMIVFGKGFKLTDNNEQRKIMFAINVQEY